MSHVERLLQILDIESVSKLPWDAESYPVCPCQDNERQCECSTPQTYPFPGGIRSFCPTEESNDDRGNSIEKKRRSDQCSKSRQETQNDKKSPGFGGIFCLPQTQKQYKLAYCKEVEINERLLIHQHPCAKNIEQKRAANQHPDSHEKHTIIRNFLVPRNFATAGRGIKFRF